MNAPATTPKPKMPYAALIGRVVEHRRSRVLNIHQEQLAQALGISQSAYSRLEKGLSAMSVTQLRIVADQLQTTPAKLLQDAEHYANQLRAQGVEITDEKSDSTAAVLIGLALLAALIAAAGS
jgi:transcriptional regulator with XRE-family HTH domain